MKDFLYLSWVAYCTIMIVVGMFQGENILGMLAAWAIMAFLVPMAIMGDNY